MGARHTNCTDIFRLASKYVWYSVLLYDKEYRDMQADEKFEWGTYRQDLRDFQLVSKRDNPTARSLFTPSFPRTFVAPLASFIAHAVGLSRLETD
jgi:hypothetical protein